ncbi:hypothetical protein [Cryobacterium zhongshanensis]|uniref:Uncharacterized protein n=1 Tax=Cryobacterium zhongshanensis TaxID=2928153 RepID=A0AA41UFR0_9MICO|nr:hypothetical protein [Cryobacterium zhongshanensis]MCI4658402.1 hypothetical protein [Cryobacterium zhongshanensis]
MNSEVQRQGLIPAPSSRWTVRDWLLCGLLVIASLMVGLVHVPQHDSISPIDEFVYIDYLAKVPTEGVVHRGEETGAYAREYFACHGVRMYIGPQPTLCQSSSFNDDVAFPFNGKTSADLYAPLYFGTTWVLAQPLMWVGMTDLTEAGRYTGWIWLAAALVLLYMTFRRLNVPRGLGFGLGILLAGSLPAYWSHTYISTDATALPAGALMIFLAIRYLQTRRHGWLLPLAAIVVALFKLQNLMAVAAVAVFFLLYSAANATGPAGIDASSRITAWRRSSITRLGVFTLVAAVAAQAVWTVTRSLIAVGPAPDQLVATQLGGKALLSEVFKFFPGAISGAVDPSSLGMYAIVIAGIGTSVVAAGVLGLLATSPPKSMQALLAFSVLLVALVSGPALGVANLLTSGFYFPLPARYGLALVPMFLCCAALLFSNRRWVGNAVGACGVLVFLLSFRLAETLT